MFNKLIAKGLKDQSGMVMPMVMMIMVLALCIVVPGLVAAGTTAKVNRDLESSTVAYYAAKAGMEDAFWKIQTLKAGDVPVLGNLTVNNMTVERALDTAAALGWDLNERKITSIAKVDGVEKARIFAAVDIYCNPEIPGTPGSPATPGVTGYPFDYAIAATGGLENVDLKVDSNSLVRSGPVDGYADVYAGGGLDVDGSVHGRGYYTGTVEGCDKIQKGCEQTAVRDFQTLDETWYLQQAQLGGYWPISPAPSGWPNLTLPLATPYGTGTYDVSGTVTLGGPGNISYINGNLNIKAGGKVILKGVVWVNGWITSNANSVIQTDPANTGKQYYLLAHGAPADGHNINIESNTDVIAYSNLNLICDGGTVTLHSNVGDRSSPALFGIVYAPSGHIKFDSNSWAIVTSVIGNSVVLDSNSMVIYDTNLGKNPVEGFELNVAPTEEIQGTNATPASTTMQIKNVSGQ